MPPELIGEVEFEAARKRFNDIPRQTTTRNVLVEAFDLLNQDRKAHWVTAIRDKTSEVPPRMQKLFSEAQETFLSGRHSSHPDIVAIAMFAGLQNVSLARVTEDYQLELLDAPPAYRRQN